MSRRCVAMALLGAMLLTGCEQYTDVGKHYNVYYYPDAGSKPMHLGIADSLKECRKVVIGHTAALKRARWKGDYSCCMIEGGNECAERLE